MDRPFYLVRIENFVCNLFVSVNGAPVYREVKGLPGNVTIPVNESVFSDQNVLKLELSSRDGEPFNSETKVRIQLILTDNNAEEGRTIIDRWQSPDFNTDEPTFAHEHTILFSAQQPYESHSWITAQAIDISDSNLVSELTTTMMSVHKAFKDGNLDLLMKMFSSRNLEFAQAYYMEQNERMNEVAESITQTMSDPGLKLLNYDLKYLRPRLYGGGRLFTLEDDEYYPGIMFVELSVPRFTAFPVFLSISDSNEIYVSK